MIREAIEYFKFNRKKFCEDYLKICPKDSIAYQTTLKEKEFYDMAIKALEQEYSDDVISRQATLEPYKSLKDTDTLCVALVRANIMQQPPVNPQPETGYWILTDVEGSKVWQCICSKCNKDPMRFVGGSENWWLIKSNLPKYCPHCGTNMKLQESEEKNE